jgi:hypothetical protein
LMTIDQWRDSLSEGDWVTGPALRKYGAELPEAVHVVDQTMWHPTAAVVGQIGWQRHLAGARDDLWSLVPHYVRKSAAEERQRADHSP